MALPNVASRVLTDEMNNKYLKLFYNKVISEHPLLRHCCFPNCQGVVKILSPNAVIGHSSCLEIIKCVLCDTELCAGCGDMCHSPAQCTKLREWNEKETNVFSAYIVL